MDSSIQIISDLQDKIGPQQPLDFLSYWKGVPVVTKGHIFKIRPESIIFKVEPPDSICFTQGEHGLILHDIFIMGIQGRILTHDLKAGTVELGEFSYVDRGFGERSIVRVEPDAPIPATLLLGGTGFKCQVVDISLNGFGLTIESAAGAKASKGQAAAIQLKLANKEIEIPGKLLGVFPKAEITRLAMSFSQDAPNHALVARYITRRRAEIRQEIQAAYEQAVR